MGHDHIKIEQENYKVPQSAKKFVLILIAIGLVLSVIGLFTIPRDHDNHGHGEDHHTYSKQTSAAVLHAGMEESTESINTTIAPNDDSAHLDMHDSAAHGATENHHNAATDETHSTEDAHKELIIVGNQVGTPIDCGILNCPNESHNHQSAAHHGHDKPWYTRIYTAVLMNSYYILLISLGGLFFYCVQYVSNAGWATTLIRIPQGMYSFFIFPAIVVFIVIILAGDDIYHWISYQDGNYAPDDLKNYDKILDGKKWFLNKPFLFGVVPVCLLIWYYLGMRLKTLANKEDVSGDAALHTKNIRTSAKFMVFFGFTFSFLAWLVIMSIDAHWFSTIFGIYHFAIMWVCSLSVIMLLTLHLRKHGYLKILKEDHIHDLSKFMFAFSVFWMYIWVAQYLLIWYANIPEESIYYTMRQDTTYYPFFVANVIFNFIVPFLLFMTRDGKRNPKVIIAVAISILIGHWNDIYVSIYPGAFNGKVVYPGLLEIGLFLVFAGAFIWWTLNAISKRGLIAVNHPFIEESATHDVGV